MSEVRIAIPEFKVCGKCQEQKAASEFWKITHKGVTRLQSYCKICSRAANQRNFAVSQERKNNVIKLPITHKYCILCKEEKLLDDFDKKLSWNGKKYPYTYCKPCALKKRAQWGRKNKNKVSIQNRRKTQILREGGVSSELLTRKRWRELKAKSKKLKLPFNIEPHDIIVPEYCPALGIKLQFNPGQSGWDSATVDRIIPAKGYVKGNIIVVSKLANTIKAHSTIGQLKAVADFYSRLELSKDGES